MVSLKPNENICFKEMHWKVSLEKPESKKRQVLELDLVEIVYFTCRCLKINLSTGHAIAL